MSDFSVNLDEALKNKGWKQNEAAEHFGVSQANISRWLKDEHRPSVKQIMKVARALGVSNRFPFAGSWQIARIRQTV